MKTAKVIPLYKSGEKNVFTNYRPISLLQFSKILEKLYNNRLDKFLNKCNILSPSQYGFRSSMSTTEALLDLVEEITTSLEKKQKYTVGVFIDLKKAFDTVDHDILYKKLHFYGLRGVAQEWIQSYLENRKQFVSFNNCHSEMLNVSCGVPQGSILGPKLFILYINDICKVSQVFKYILFADDTNLLCCDKDLNKLIRMINGGLEQLQTWFSVNRLSLNISKTNYVIFGNRRITADICVRINKEKINRVNSTTFLGVVIDCKLNWKSHILSVRSKLSKCCAIMYRASSLINKHGMHILYYSLFMPYIMYCAEVWGDTYATNTRCLVLLQKRVTRLICGAKRLDHTNLLFHNVHILKLPDLVKLKTAIIMFKAYRYILPMNVQKLFKIHESQYSSRHKCKFKQIYVRTNLKSMCISVTGVKLWNSLDNSLISCINVHHFKKCYTNRLLNGYVLDS